MEQISILIILFVLLLLIILVPNAIRIYLQKEKKHYIEII